MLYVEFRNLRTNEKCRNFTMYFLCSITFVNFLNLNLFNKAGVTLFIYYIKITFIILSVVGLFLLFCRPRSSKYRQKSLNHLSVVSPFCNFKFRVLLYLISMNQHKVVFKEKNI